MLRRSVLLAAAALLSVPTTSSAAIGLTGPEITGLDSMSGDITSFALARVDGDADVDIALQHVNGGNHTVSVRRAGADRGWANPRQESRQDIAGTGLPQDLAVADINGDGAPDMLSTSFTQIAYSSGSSGGIFGALTSQASGTGLGAVAIGQWITGTPRPEGLYLIPGTPGTVGVLANNGGSSSPLTPTTGVSTLANPSDLGLGDADADGNPDLFVANAAGTEVIRGNGSNAVLSRIARSLPSAPAGLAVGDLDGDGRADLAVALPGAQSVRWFPSAGITTAPAGGIDLPIGRDATDLAIADLDGDGRNEVITANAPDQSVSVVAPGVAARTFKSLLKPTRLQVADVNRDGRLDVNTLDSQSRTITTLFGFEPPIPPDTAPPPPPPPALGGTAPILTPPITPVVPRSQPAVALACQAAKRKRRTIGVDCTARLSGGATAKALKAVLRRGRTAVATKTVNRGTTLKLRRSRGRSLAKGSYTITLTVTQRAGTPLTARQSLTVR